MKYYAIIVAGGKGLRMGGDVPKQFQLVGGRPVLMHTLQQFRNAIADLQIILVLPREQQDYWCELCRQYEFGVEHRVADGGQTRFHSVKNGLALIPDGEEGIVGVHDGVRPFASADLIRRCYAAVVEAEAVVPAVPVVESLRHEERGAIDRKGYRLVQTPQTFSIPLLKAAYRQDYREAFTDDASVVEAYGHRVAMIDGIRENIKLTTPFDMVVAEALLAESEK
ncbi:MAG: 2-C-methyl-D-erythritol 4-phosphate cytidylyltransferase [Prevotella sp.]|nr:2-C-methyl-D-erythritol 4-phosphate cytidylyltransferase [Prevotella sp.]